MNTDNKIIPDNVIITNKARDKNAADALKMVELYTDERGNVDTEGVRNAIDALLGMLDYANMLNIIFWADKNVIVRPTIYQDLLQDIKDKYGQLV